MDNEKFPNGRWFDEDLEVEFADHVSPESRKNFEGLIGEPTNQAGSELPRNHTPNPREHIMNLRELNTGENGARELADAMHQEHRTTQALVAETMCRALLLWARESRDQNRTDLRNELAVDKVIEYLGYAPSVSPSHLQMYTC